jgi:hypothetical protein
MHQESGAHFGREFLDRLLQLLDALRRIGG